MIQYLKSIIIIFLLYQSNTLFSQSTIDKYNNAKYYFENRNYNQTIQNLKSLESQIGANPKIQSLLIYSYVALKDYTNAKIELEKFKKLIGFKRTESIQAILTLETEINNGVKNADQNYRQNILSKRMAEARNIVDRGITANNNKRIALNNQFNNSKEQATKNANPVDIASALSTLDYSKKTELQKALRNEKKINRRWEIQFSDKKMSEIAKLTFYEYNQKGDLIKFLTKEFGDVSNIAFSDFPSFENKMITTAYIDEIENKQEYSFIFNNQIIPIKRDNQSSFQKVIHYYTQKTNTGFYHDSNLRYEWKNQDGEVVKDSIIEKNRLSINNYNKAFRSYTTYSNGRLSSYSFTDITRIKDSAIEKDTYKSYEKTGVVTSNSSMVKLYNVFNDVYVEKSDNYNVHNIFRYDIYGNIQYQDQFFSAYGTTKYNYTFNFYQYFDGYTTPTNDFINQIKANTPIAKILTKKELSEHFQKGIINFKKSNLPEAKRFLSICLEDDSSNIEYNYWMAKTYISANALEKAKNTINKILTLDPSFSPAYELLGNIYLKNFKTQATALEYYKLAAEWGVTSKIKTLEAYKIKFKLDKNLFEDEMSQEPIEINNMIFEYDEEKKYYAKILKVDNRIDFQFLSTTDLNSGYGTSMEFKQSRKNPNLYIWKPNPNYRLIVTKNFIIYYFPDGNNLFKPVKL